MMNATKRTPVPHLGDEVEHHEGGGEHDDLADDNERTVFAELAVGLLDHHTNERVGDTVPDAHDGNNGTGQHGCQTDDTDQEVADVTDHHHVGVGGGVVQSVHHDLPHFRSVDAVFFKRLFDLCHREALLSILRPVCCHSLRPFIRSPWAAAATSRTGGFLCIHYELSLKFLLVKFCGKTGQFYSPWAKSTVLKNSVRHFAHDCKILVQHIPQNGLVF